MSSLVPSAPGASAARSGETGAPDQAASLGDSALRPMADGIRPPLRRPRVCAVSGTAAGLSRHLGAPVWAVRALLVLLAMVGGAGVLLYLWCWAFTPWEAGDDAPTRRVPVAWLTLAVGMLWMMVATAFLGWPSGYPQYGGAGFSLVVGTMAVTFSGLWAALIDRADPARGLRHAAIARTVAVVLLGVMIVILLTAVDDGARRLVPVPLAGIGAVFSASLIRRWRALSGERIRRIREEQRAEMAAHLHDSVLQTLALIQNRAGASSEAARLARAQERELRSWLYDGDTPADGDLATDLRDYAGALELDYSVRIDVVSAGLSAERASGEVAAAAREAMLNAARHAGGDVSVYIEGRGTGVEVFIRDRGAGFDPDGVPGDRLGVRESIIGRMRRVGGAAGIRSGENGTEVHLRLNGAAP